VEASTSFVPTRHDFSDIKAGAAFTLLSSLYGPALAAKQIELEHDAYTQGEERFHKGLLRSIARSEYADSAPAKPILQALVPRFSARFVEWVEEQKKVRRKAIALPYLQHVNPETLAVLTIKRTLSLLASSGNGVAFQKITKALGLTVEDEVRYGRIREQEAKHYKSYVAPALAKRSGQAYKKAFLQAVEGHMIKAEELSDSWVPWEAGRGDVPMLIGIKLIEILMESTGLVTPERTHVGTKKESQTLRLSPEWEKLLISRAFTLSGIDPVYQPCVVPPKPWTGNKGGGYWANGRKPTNLIRLYSKAGRERYHGVHMPAVYKAVNLAQQSAWRVNPKVLAVVEELSTWKHVGISDFPTQEPQELPLKTEGMEQVEELLAAWKKEAAQVYRSESARVSRRIRLEFTLSQAQKFSGFDAIWFPYNLDWRGRVYALPSFNPQGNDMTKGLLTAAHGAPIGADGRKWLAVHGANCAGVDKVPFAERTQWVEDNTALILACAEDPYAHQEWMSMDSPFCFLAFCFEWAGVMIEGDDYVCSLPVAFDGSCSGIQHFSAMLRDAEGGAAVNLVPSDKVQDVYRRTSDEVNITLRRDALTGTDDETVVVTDPKTGDITEKVVYGTKRLAQAWLDFGVDRSVTKRPVMTLPYGSKEYGFSDQVLEDTINPALDRGEAPMFAVNKGQFARYMAKCIWAAVGKIVVAAVEAMDWLQSAAALMAAEVKDRKTGEILKPKMSIKWVTPDGFPVWQEYMKPTTRRIDLMFLGTHRMEVSVVTGSTNELDSKKQEAGVSPNFVHSQDGSHLRKTVVHANEAYGIDFFALIHDSFGAIPAHAGSLFKAVRETLVETYDTVDVLADFKEQFEDQLHDSQLTKMPPLPARGTLDLQLILQSDFAFA
jgi:DNA-directed RNA polymerase